MVPRMHPRQRLLQLYTFLFNEQLPGINNFLSQNFVLYSKKTFTGSRKLGGTRNTCTPKMATSSIGSSIGPGDVFLGLDSAKMLFDAVSLVIKEKEEFRSLALPAKKSLENVQKLLKWRSSSDDNKKAWEDFAVNYVGILKKCFDTKPEEGVKKFRRHTEKERTCACFYQTVTSDSFNEGWAEFLALAGCNAQELFYQHVTELLFKELRKLRYPDDDKQIGLTCAEEHTV